ncbi:MAG: sugar phosphate isomerase/epimerase [Defluviitaleaceae bacterium]|nr:sugar phosphate isomerase/epimerase [Defluviitaleaceae bacterium]
MRHVGYEMRIFGARAHDFGRFSADELAATVKGAGFDCVQLAPAKAIEGISRIADINARHLEEIKEAFVRHGLGIAVLGCYIEPSVPDEEERLANVKTFRDNLAHAKVLGVDIVGTETTRLPTDASNRERETRYALLKDSVLRMTETAEKAGVNIGIEPVAGHTLNTPALTRRLLDEVRSNKLKIIFDPANLLLPETVGEQDRIFAEMIRLCGEDVAVMHIKNITIVDGQKVWCNMGEGLIDYRFVFDWLNSRKPHLPLMCDELRPESYGKDLNTLRRYAEGRF